MVNDFELVSNVIYAFSDSWNNHDMEAFSQLFHPDAEFVNVVGLWWKGRREIKEAHIYSHSNIFKDSTLTITDLSIRFLRDDIALARATWRLEGHVSPEGFILPARMGILLNLIELHDNEWQIIDSQNTDIVEGELSRPQDVDA